MAILKSKDPCSLTLRVLAHLLRYPDDAIRSHANDLKQALAQESALSASRREELNWLIDHIASAPALDAEADYVETFDNGRLTSLYLFEHVHGDSRDRGPAMIDLIQTYEQAGLYLSEKDLPDYLPVVLEYASTQPPVQAREFLREIVHLAQLLFSALQNRESPYASVLAAVVELAGEQARAVQLPEQADLDESWAEPEAFDGCATQGQNRPGQDQPIHLVRTVNRTSNKSSGAQA